MLSEMTGLDGGALVFHHVPDTFRIGRGFEWTVR